MTSRKQIAANRRNAKKSTGPRSAATKAITRLNAKRDGITGQVITLSDEDRPVFEKLKAELIANLAPKTIMELRLANSIAWDTWRLDVLRAVEANTYALGANDPGIVIDAADVELHTALSTAITYEKNADKFGNMSLYEQRLNRGIHKNLATLRTMQAERKRNFNSDLTEEVMVARASEINGLDYQTPPAPTQNGSVFSNDEVFTAANRLTTLTMAKKVLLHTPMKVQYAGASAWPTLIDPLPPPSYTAAAPHQPREVPPGYVKTGMWLDRKPASSATEASPSDPKSGANPSFLSR